MAKSATRDPKLTDRQQRFVDSYLMCWNASEAARQAGYSKKTAGVIGYENLKKPQIRAAIDVRLAEMRMSANEVLARLTAQASGSLAPFVQTKGEDVWVDLTTDEANANLHLLKEIETERRRYGKKDDPVEEFKVKIKIHDPQAALVQLGRYHKLFAERVEHAGTDGGPIQVEDINATRDRRWEGLAPVIKAALVQGDPDAAEDGGPANNE